MRDNWDIAVSKQTRRQRAMPPCVSLNRCGEIAMNAVIECYKTKYIEEPKA